MKSYTQLCTEERAQIEILNLEGYSCRKIAKAMGRSHTTISREIKRNLPTDEFCYLYDAEVARKKDLQRRSKSRLRGWLTCKVTRKYVRKKLKLMWSPEQIAGRISVDLPGYSVCHESIYCYIYRHANELIECLARKRPARVGHTYFFKSTGNRIPHRTDISERPEHINERVEFGHWEVDLIVSSKSKEVLSVLVERVSRRTIIRKMSEKKAGPHKDSIIQRLEKFDKVARMSITYDNGTENTLHYQINTALDMDSYFCKPYHSWEKGTVENTNGLIRRYLPKKTDFSEVSDAEIRRIENALNNRPRKCLDYKTPNEIFKEQLNGALSH